MGKEIIAASIALIGVIVSVLISFITSRKQASIEVEKLRSEIHQDFSLRLFDKRLEQYPDLYQYLSEFKKVIQYEEVTQERIIGFFRKLQEWDSRNSILFGSDTGKLLYHFRKEVFSLTRRSNQEIQVYFNDSETKYSFIKKMAQLELSLKSELGIYTYNSPTDIREAKQFRSYQEVTEFSRQRTQLKNSKSRPNNSNAADS
ncbi:MAG: hypothetical protein F6K42_12465 [Leptolyngbya sp. SIO1D8]|nr:hypothetical protein [Leptolyngbya sp. SIO1D8]